MIVSKEGLDLIKQFEGFKNYVYTCPAGKPTIGYGHVIEPRLLAFTRASPPISEEKAEELLASDVKAVQECINSSVRVSLTQGKYDALVSLIYNWGAFNFKASNSLQKLNSGDYDKAAEGFFSKEKGVVNINRSFSEGLYRRRQAELKLWQS